MEKFVFAAVVTAVAGIIFYSIDEASASADLDSKVTTTATTTVDLKTNAK
ncbi:MAG TPA: hypothetical protein V6C86_05590 [Oculatellaceae cyanobacterium]